MRVYEGQQRDNLKEKLTNLNKNNIATCSRPLAANSSVHLVKKFEWQLIFCLNTLIFILQTHMQKFSTCFPAVFF